MQAIRRRCIDPGEEGELSFIDFHSVLIHIWRGSMAEATLIAEDTVERALQLNGDLPLSVALTVRAAVAAYAGDEETVRRDVADALAASERCGSRRLGEWPVTMLGFLDVSLGNYEAAIETRRAVDADAGGGPGFDGGHQRVLRSRCRRGPHPLGQARRGRADDRGTRAQRRIGSTGRG